MFAGYKSIIKYINLVGWVLILTLCSNKSIKIAYCGKNMMTCRLAIHIRWDWVSNHQMFKYNHINPTIKCLTHYYSRISTKSTENYCSLFIVSWCSFWIIFKFIHVLSSQKKILELHYWHNNKNNKQYIQKLDFVEPLLSRSIFFLSNN